MVRVKTITSLVLFTVCVLVIGCSLSKKTPLIYSTQKEIMQPILYLDQEGERLFVRGVYPDGKRLTLPTLWGESNMNIITPTWSPDGTWFVYVYVKEDINNENTEIRLGNLKGETKTIFTSARETSLSQPIWSPDGKKLASIMVELPTFALSLVVIDVIEQKILSTYNIRTKDKDSSAPSIAPMEIKSSFRWSPDGKKILLPANILDIKESPLMIIDTIKGVIEELADKPLVSEWSMNSDAIYYFDVVDLPASKEEGYDVERHWTFGDFYVKKMDNPQPVKLLDKEQIETLGLSTFQAVYGVMTLSPKGTKLAIRGGSDYTEDIEKQYSVIYIYDLTSDQTVAFDKPVKRFRINEFISALDWGPDENSLAAVVFETEGFSIKLLDLNTGEWKTLAKVAEGVTGEAGEVILWRYATDTKVMTWTH